MLRNLEKSEKYLLFSLIALTLSYFVGKLILATVYLPTLEKVVVEAQLFGWMFLIFSALGQYFVSPYNVGYSLAGLITMGIVLLLFREVPLWKRVIYAYLIGIIISAFQTLTYFPN